MYLVQRRCAWILGLWLLVAPGDAAASTASTATAVDVEGFPYEYAKFTAARGEQNRVTVRGRFGRVVIRDSGSRMRTRGGCRALGPHAAKCPAGYAGPSISLRDGNDRVNLRGSGTAYGGAGNDRLTGGSYVSFFGGTGKDVLRGGAQNDWLNGGAGRDRLYGRGEADDLFDGETDADAARDLFNGGAPGFSGNTLHFTRRQKSLRVDLERGQASTRDTILGVQNITGGSGDDELTGDDADNRLRGGRGDDAIDGGAGNDSSSGGPGNDRLSGGVGNDYLEGHSGADGLDGGPGNDELHSREADDDGGQGSRTMPDEVGCGDGADKAWSDAPDTLERACEQLVAEDIQIATVPALRGDHAEFIATSRVGRSSAAVGTLSLHSPAGEEYGRAGYVVPPDGTTTVSVPLTPNGVAALRAGIVVEVTVVSDGLTTSSGYRMFLRAG
jgi:hypothetical protein